MEGAPADVFISAAPEWMDAVAEAGLIVPESRVDILGNRLVLIAHGPGVAPVTLDATTDLAGMLAGGRLSMAMALVPRPPLLLVDEPFDGVDLDGVDTITELLVEARADGAAVVLTTHLLDAAVIADDVAVFRQHELTGPHPTRRLLEEHGTLQVAWKHLAHS